jgi:hypothetical protein
MPGGVSLAAVIVSHEVWISMNIAKFMLLALLLSPALAQAQDAPATARKSCEELKNEIDAKLQAKGVQNYTLDIVAADDVGDQQVVGSCDGGQGRIVYTRGENKPAR